MASLSLKERVDELRQRRDNRRFQRVSVCIAGRYMLADQREYPCRTIDISAGGVAVRAPVSGEIGSRVLIYLEHLGRLEGQLVRTIDRGFAAQINVPTRKRDKLADQLTWLANRELLGLQDGRRHERIEPINRRTILKIADGSETIVQIIDVSISGSAIETRHRPALGEHVTLGRTQGIVVRHLANGIAIEFARELPEKGFDPGIRL